MSVFFKGSLRSFTKGENSKYDSLSAVYVAQQFAELADNGVIQSQANIVNVVQNLAEKRDLTKLSPEARFVVDRKCESVGVKFETLMQELVTQEQLQQAKFRNDNLRPSFMPKPK